MLLVRASVEGKVATIALDNYAKRNALSAPLIAELIAALDRFAAEGVRAVVLRSASPQKVWSSGHDIEELPKADTDPLPYTDPLEALMRAVKDFPAPVIAMVQGSAWGGACELVMACDIVLGDETCAFAVTPAKLGLPYNVAGVLNFMNRLPLTVAKEMFFTADLIASRRAEQVGIINMLLPAADLETRTYAMARLIASRSPAAIAALKKAMGALSDGVAVTPSVYEYIHGLRREVYFGPDYHEGIRAFMEKRPARF
jgi:methylmalonyl-CoA decarboxylase